MRNLRLLSAHPKMVYSIFFINVFIKLKLTWLKSVFISKKSYYKVGRFILPFNLECYNFLSQCSSVIIMTLKLHDLSWSSSSKNVNQNARKITLPSSCWGDPGPSGQFHLEALANDLKVSREGLKSNPNLFLWACQQNNCGKLFEIEWVGRWLGVLSF